MNIHNELYLINHDITERKILKNEKHELIDKHIRSEKTKRIINTNKKILIEML